MPSKKKITRKKRFDDSYSVNELRQICKDNGITFSNLNKVQLLKKINKYVIF